MIDWSSNQRIHIHWKEGPIMDGSSFLMLDLLVRTHSSMQIIQIQ